ncbi:hypothetical protein HS041_30185 [Planomonospora sp. ID67723]|uniref:hypothetical protein n=1 Tax=Planomonospora sp. ID67723 TaxID=2738134 RepID=UPI0018C35FA7|nr:hypothetical protein [Planomonospora sp. ID67723]MBG0831977.1 hypothetical protein [Planomonospora sp. ID67723]
MGYDTSFHAVDIALVEDRLLPFIIGYGSDSDLDRLTREAVERRKVRFHAKAWALGALRAAEARGADTFEPHLHVWGRPYFVIADSAEQVVQDVLRYQSAGPDDVPTLAREMIARLDPGLVDLVEPDTQGTLPADHHLAMEISWRMRVLRLAVAAVRSGTETIRDPDTGREHSAAALVAREIPFSVVEYAAALTPGWMSRGKVWPTHLCRLADVPAGGFGLPQALFAPLREMFPQLSWMNEPTIVENYMVGGLVPPGDVAGSRRAFATRFEAIMAVARRDGWEPTASVNLTKIDEAFALAGHLGYGFCEATEIYNGMAGSLN